MSTPYPTRPPFPPGVDATESDESLAVPLRAGSDAAGARSVALLMARHWRPAQEYAAICLAASGTPAHMVTAAAFHQILDRVTLGEPADALRPRLLVAVRDMVAIWSAEEGITEVLPDLAKPAGGRGMRAAKNMTAENRKLAGRAFNGLPRLAQTLLWHTAVEAEPINVPAALLGMDTDSAAFALDEARDKFREGCVRAHRELAPSKDCRFYNRLLEVPIRRGGALLPDVRRHLAECRYCHDAADQLALVETGSGLLLAEAVLGWGARRDHDSRPGRLRPSGARARAVARHAGGHQRVGGRHRMLARIQLPLRGSLVTARTSRTLLTGVGVAGAGLLATVLAVGVWSDGGDGTAPVATATATGAHGGTPSKASPSPPATRQTRLRNAASGLCLDIKGRPRAGAGVTLEVCSSAWTQQWTYEKDGLLRSVAEAGLCLDSHADAGVVILGDCADAADARGDDVRYDLTVQGEFLPRWDQSLALAATGTDPGAAIVVKVRDGSPALRWLTDPPPVTRDSRSSPAADAPAARPVDLTP